MKKKIILFLAICLSLPSIGYSLDALVENFTGPTLDPTWGLIEGGGAFNGLGQYIISDNGSKGVNGISRIVGKGDFECHFDANVSFGGANTKLGFEFWDDSSALSTFDAFLVQLATFNGTSFQLVVYQWTNGVLSSTTVFNNNTVPTLVKYKVTWTEATKQWGLSYGINGEARDAHVANLASLPAYGMGSATTRRLDIWTDHWGAGTIVMSADLDYYKIFDPFNPVTKAHNPVPAFDGGVLDIAGGGNLSWAKGDLAYAPVMKDSHKVYFGTSYNDVNNATTASPQYRGSTNVVGPDADHGRYSYSALTYETLALGQTYYWRIDEVNTLTATTWKGDVWNFTTPTGKAINPVPSDKVGGVDPAIATLQWTPGGAFVLNQDVYFSSSFDDVNNGAAGALIGNNIAGNATSIAVPGSPLPKGKLYFWRVDSKCGALGTAKGDVWRFKTAYPVEICDNFNTARDYLVSGTTGTIWDGIIGKDTALTLATDYNLGKLYMESGGNWWSGNSQGVLLYKEIVGSFIAEVEVTDYSGLWDLPNHASWMANNWGGIMARVGNLDDAGPGEDWITISYFPIYTNGNRGDLNGWYSTNYAVAYGRTWTGWNAGRFLQLESDGAGTFFQRWSTDGITWQPLNPFDPWIIDDVVIGINPTVKADMAGLPLQVGLCHSLYSINIGYIEFDNFCLGRDLIAKAYSPLPNDGGGLDLMKPILSWAPGDFAVSHVVYFGTDPNALNNRGSANVVGPDASGRFSYNAGQFETLVIGNKYYWRIDEVNAVHPDSPWVGNVWEFTMLDYSTIDDFERYTATGNVIVGGTPPAGTLRKVWIDGLWSATKVIPQPPPSQPQYKITTNASFVQLNTDPCDGKPSRRQFNNASIALAGKKSMKFYYENDGFWQWWVWLYGSDPVLYKWTAPKFSEVFAAIDDAARVDAVKQSSLGLKRNWSGYKLLRIPFYGDPNNTLVSTDKLYVGLWDGDNNPTTPVVITHPDNTKLQKNLWQDWYVPLSSFPTANANFSLSNVARIYLGVGDRTTPATGGIGNLFFDDLQILAYGVCIPGTVKTDFNNDCRTDMNDLEMMTEVWLGAAPAGASPIISLDASALTIGNLTTWSNTGTGSGKFDANTADAGAIPQVAMVDGRKAVVFDGNDFMIWRDASNVIKSAPASITGSSDWTVIIEARDNAIALEGLIVGWAKRGGPDEGTCAAVGYGNGPSFGAAVHWGAPDLGYDRGVPPANIWHTIAVTYQGDVNGIETVVVDGVVNASEAKTLDIWDANAVVLGTYEIAADAAATPGAIKWGNSWIVPARTIMFSGAVSKIEVYDYAMTPGQLAMKMGTPINLINDTIINFKDLAVLANKWLVGPVLLQ